MQWTTECMLMDLEAAIDTVRREGRNEIRYAVYDDEGNDAVQTLTLAQAELVRRYLRRRPDVRFVGCGEHGPAFRHVLEPLPWEISWQEAEADAAES